MGEEYQQEGFGAEGEAYTNVGESWAIYDTVQIRSDIPKGSNLGYNSYAALGSPNAIPFFNVRNSGEVGEAMCNLETKDQMPFAYWANSIGVRFSAPLGINEPPHVEEGAISGVSNMSAHAIFVQEVPLFAVLKLKVQQDEKLIHTCYLAPEGSGPFGIAGIVGAGVQGGNTSIGAVGVTSLTQGYPSLPNRWPFPVPIGIPRGATMSAQIVFTDYCKELLKAMPGPSEYGFYNSVASKIAACSTIRVSLFGNREVQQRGQIHR
jgi:hypothetical protein